MKLYQFSGFCKPYFTPDSVACWFFFFSVTEKCHCSGAMQRSIVKQILLFGKVDFSSSAHSKYCVPSWQAGPLIHRRGIFGCDSSMQLLIIPGLVQSITSVIVRPEQLPGFSERNHLPEDRKKGLDGREYLKHRRWKAPLCPAWWDLDIELHP